MKKKTLRHYRNLYYMKSVFFFYKTWANKIPFSIRKFTIFFFILILIYVLEYE